MKDEWSGYLSRVSSGSLIYAMDPDFVGVGYSQEDALHAIGNILNANDFDSIPLVEKYAKNSKNRLVRRPIEDQAPFIDRELFLSEMIIDPIDQ